MRNIKSLDDAQKVINELLEWKERISTKNWDFHKLRITNASPGVDPDDYATVKQIPQIPELEEQKDLNYSLIYTKEGVVVTGEAIPDAIIGRGREGIPVEVYLSAQIAPSAGNLAINMNVNGNNILTTDLILSQGSTAVVRSALFTSPSPTIGFGYKVHPIITSGGAASFVTVVLTVKRIRSRE